jgi:hypothetical protein
MFSFVTETHGQRAINPRRSFDRLSSNKRELAQQCLALVCGFVLDGHKVTVCRPAFAHGVETPLAVRQAIRAEGRA